MRTHRYLVVLALTLAAAVTSLHVLPCRDENDLGRNWCTLERLPEEVVHELCVQHRIPTDVPREQQLDSLEKKLRTRKEFWDLALREHQWDADGPTCRPKPHPFLRSDGDVFKHVNTDEDTDTDSEEDSDEWDEEWDVHVYDDHDADDDEAPRDARATADAEEHARPHSSSYKSSSSDSSNSSSDSNGNADGGSAKGERAKQYAASIFGAVHELCDEVAAQIKHDISSVVSLLPKEVQAPLRSAAGLVVRNVKFVVGPIASEAVRHGKAAVKGSVKSFATTARVMKRHVVPKLKQAVSVVKSKIQQLKDKQQQQKQKQQRSRDDTE